MLRNVLLISGSGIVLFSKEFVKVVSQPGLIGGLVMAMLDFSTQRVGVPVSFIALSTVGVSIHTNVHARVTCALFYDIADGQDFGKLIATEILNAFTGMYASTLAEGKQSASDAFHDFHLKILEVIRNSVRPVLEQLSQQRGIELCVLTGADSIQHATGDIDKLGLLANHQALLGSATDIMASKNDVVSGITLKGATTTTVLRRIERSSLVVLYTHAPASTAAGAKKLSIAAAAINANPSAGAGAGSGAAAAGANGAAAAASSVAAGGGLSAASAAAVNTSVLCDAEINKAARLLGRILNMLSNLQDAR